MNNAIGRGLRSHRHVKIDSKLREEISHWLFLESWVSPLPWRDERHVNLNLSSDASGSGWGAVLGTVDTATISDYWREEDRGYDIATREALALVKAISSFADRIRNSRVDARVDNMAVVHAWEKQGGRSVTLNRVIKELFFETVRLNISLHLSYVATQDNSADAPSRRLSLMDSKLQPGLWTVVQREFGGASGHTCDLMALDSNAMPDTEGHPLPHFTPYPSPASKGVNLFGQDLTAKEDFLQRPYVFPPIVLTGPVLQFLRKNKRDCTIVVIVTYPHKYWWPLLVYYSAKSIKLAEKGS